MASWAKETLPLLNNHASDTSAGQEYDQLRLELRHMRQAALQWNAERSELISELDQLRHLVADSDAAAALALERQVASQVNRVRAESAVEADRLRSQVEELTRTIHDNDSERSRLAAQLEEARRSLTETDQAAAIALEFQVSTGIDRARQEFAVEAEKLHRELEKLAAERDTAMQELAATKERHQRQLAEADIFSANSQRDRAENDKLRQKLSQVLTAFELERAELVAERDRANRALTEQAEQHCRILSDAQDAAEQDKAAAIEVVRNELEAQTDKLRQEVQQQLSQIATDTRRTTLGASACDSVRAEIARVETLIQTISELIEDEATQLSVVIRKNAERAELESYLRGIRFLMSE